MCNFLHGLLSHPVAHTHLAPSLAGALTLVSGSEAEADDTATGVGGLKVEGAFTTVSAAVALHVSLQNTQDNDLSG